MTDQGMAELPIFNLTLLRIGDTCREYPAISSACRVRASEGPSLGPFKLFQAGKVGCRGEDRYPLTDVFGEVDEIPRDENGS